MTTRLLRWRTLTPPPRNADKVLAVGDTDVDGLDDGLIQIERRGPLRDGTGGWTVMIRREHDPGQEDHWLWMPAYVGGPHEDLGSAISSEQDAKAIVAENFEQIEEQARSQLAAALAAPVAGDDAAETERDRQADEALGLLAGADMLSSVAAVEPQELEPRDARVSEDMQRALAEAYLGAAQDVADRLRAAAAEVERHITPRVSSRDLRANFTDRAAEIVSDVQAMMGNLSLNRLVRTARDADLAVRGRMP
jgi:hypothetical protein